MGSGLARKWAPGLSVETPKRRPPRSLTHAAWLLSRPLVILLACDCLLPHQLKGRLALKLECITVAKPGAFPPAVGRYARISATALLDLCKTGKEKTETRGDSMPLRAGRPCCTSATRLGSEGPRWVFDEKPCKVVFKTASWEDEALLVSNAWTLCPHRVFQVLGCFHSGKVGLHAL